MSTNRVGVEGDEKMVSLLGTNCKHVNDDILLIGSRKISMSALTEISDWRNGPR